MPNIKRKIDNHNKKQLKKPDEEPKQCNCRKNTTCPLDRKCQHSGIIYQATVKQEGKANKEAIETYIGLTDTPFKLRLANHKQSFKNPKLRNSTELSKHIWSLNENKKAFSLTWKLISKASSYNNKSKHCNLCTEEKYYIICHPEQASLNQRVGLITPCPHAKKYLLSRFPT